MKEMRFISITSMKLYICCLLLSFYWTEFYANIKEQ